MTEVVSRDVEWARKITERLRLQATNYQEAREKVISTMHEAREGGAADLLGYPSWTAYMTDVLGETPMRLDRDSRQELVRELSEQGMSTRAIATIVDKAQTQVMRDLQVNTKGSPAANAAPEPDAPVPVVGLDGKEYKRSEPSKPKRKPITSTAESVAWELRRAVERLEKLCEDDRFSQYRKEIRTTVAGNLTHVVEACQGFLDSLNEE